MTFGTITKTPLLITNIQTVFMSNHNLEFDNWFDILLDSLRGMGFTKCPDVDTAKDDYDLGLSPEESADEFAKEWGDLGDGDV